MLTGLSLLEQGLISKPTGGLALDAYYIDSVAGDDANAGTELAPWATPLPLIGRAGGVEGDPKLVYIKKGSSFTGMGIKVDTNYWTIGTYGPGSDPVTFNNLVSIKGTTNDWTDEGSNRWSRSGFASTGGTSDHGRDQVVFDGVGGIWCTTTSAINAATEWRRVDSTGKIWVYSTSNPATAFTTLEHVPDVADGAATGQAIEFPNIAKGIHVDGGFCNIDSAGFEFYGFTRFVYVEGGSSDVVIENWKFQFGYQGIILDNALNNGLVTDDVHFGPGKIFDTGLYDGSSAIYLRQGVVTAAYFDDIHVDAQNAEDGFQMGGNNSSFEMRTAYVTGCRFERTAENPIDTKVGDLILVDCFAQADETQQTCVTSQGHANMFKARNCCLSGLDGQPAVQVHEGYKNYADIERCMLFSDESSVYFQVASGAASRFAFNVACTTFNTDSEILRIDNTSEGTFIHNTTVAFSTTGSVAVSFEDTPVSGGVTSIIRTPGAAVGGFYEYTIIKTAGLGNFRDIRISGLTGASAELNSLTGEYYTLTDVSSASDTSSKILVAASQFAGSPIDTVVLTGISITYFAKVDRLANNLLSGYAAVHSAIGAVLDIENAAAIQSDFVNEPNFVTGSGALVKYPSTTTYTAAQVISDVAAGGNLSFDTGGKLGGSTWKSGTTQACTPVSVTSITCDGYYATVACTDHGLLEGEMFAIDGVTNHVQCNGSHFVASVTNANEFLYQLPRALWGLTASLATGTIVMADGTASVDVTGASILTIADMGLHEGKDIKGRTLADADLARNFGAVQPTP
jgi:hypothetical protein